MEVDFGKLRKNKTGLIEMGLNLLYRRKTNLFETFMNAVNW